MSRLTWNDCCCGPLVGITGDMILVRAGWYHFMVMTLDGRVNCFIGSGLEGQENDTYGGSTPIDTRGWGFWNYDWLRVNKSEVFSDLSTNGRATEAYNPNQNPDKAFWSLEETIEDIAIHVPADSVRQDTATQVQYNCSQRDVYPSVDSLFPLNEGVCVNGGCWYERNQIKAFDGIASNATSNFYDWYWPHGYLEFDGSGCTAGRPYKIDGVTSERWKYLITKEYGTFGDFGSVNFNNYCNGLTGITMVEEYKPPVKPAPVGHPLRVPNIPTITEGDTTRPLKVIDIECGAYHNVIRLEDNTIMCWGLNSMGQCNVPDSLKHGSSSPHPKLNKIFSIHAGFSNTAVMFNDGTVLCWGDPEVACAVNNWTDIRVSPIKRHNGQPGDSSSCKGANSTGYPDPDNPEYPANKYDKPTYNANTDWFKYWRSGTPGYPHFDLGVEVDPIYPVNWGGLIVDYLTSPINGGCNLFEPKSWCAECEDPTYGMSIGKDFAVGMRRTGQIITSKKGPYVNTENDNLYSRDCSFDSSAVYQAESGVVDPGDIGPNYNNVKFCCGGNVPPGQDGNCPSWCGPGSPGDCREYLAANGTIQKCNSYSCSAYDKWSLSSAYADFCTTRIKPTGIGCFNSKYGEYGYDPNWAITTNKYQAGKQVIPNGFAGNTRYPTWNTIDASYGWSTLVVVPGRSKPTTKGLVDVPELCVAPFIEATYCVMDKGSNEACDQFCPSNPGFIWSNALGNVAGRRGNGVPGYFRYPLHMATALTCIAGTNTVGWVSSAQTLGRDLTAIGTARDNITDSAVGNCDQYHWMGNIGVDCSECAYVGGNAAYHTEEVGKVEYGCIFAQPSGIVPAPPNTNKDKNGINNPFSEDTYNQACLASPEQIQDDWGFPTKPWGPWNITTNIGFANPRYVDLAVCNTGLKRANPYVSYKSSGNGLDGSGDLLNVPWRTPLGPGMPSWFMNSCIRDLRQFSVSDTRTIYGGSFPTTHTSKFRVVVNGLCPDEIFGPGEVTLQKDCYALKNPQNCGCNPRGISYLWTCDESLFECNDNTKWVVDAKPDVDFTYPGRAGGNGVPALPARTLQDVVNTNGYAPLSGQQGFTCEAGTQDTLSRWCWNNPIISYATGRSFGVHIRACPWSRGLSGEFVWKESCKETNEYFNKISQFGFDNSTSKQTKSLKLWVSGILEDPCPPWPVDVDLNGITCGVYPSWVPVPSTNTTKRADKGEWTYTVTTWPGCTATWGYTLGCETSWPSGVTGCTGTDNCASSI